MNRQKKIIIGVIVLAVLLMAIGYAGLNSTDLTINGTATATAVQDNFKVYFTNANTTKVPDGDVIVSTTNESPNATVTISGLNKKDDTAYAILEIKNGSNDVDASSVNVSAQGEDNAVIDIAAEMCTKEGQPITNYAVDSGDVTYVKVSATLLSTPTEDVSTNIAVTITAEPKL